MVKQKTLPVEPEILERLSLRVASERMRGWPDLIKSEGRESVKIEFDNVEVDVGDKTTIAGRTAQKIPYKVVDPDYSYGLDVPSVDDIAALRWVDRNAQAVEDKLINALGNPESAQAWRNGQKKRCADETVAVLVEYWTSRLIVAVEGHAVTVGFYQIAATVMIVGIAIDQAPRSDQIEFLHAAKKLTKKVQAIVVQKRDDLWAVMPEEVTDRWTS